jgi:hypothetical protein
MTLASEPMPRLTNYESNWSSRTTNTKEEMSFTAKVMRLDSST